MPQNNDASSTPTSQLPNGKSGPSSQRSKDQATSALATGVATGARDLTSEVKHVASDVAGQAGKVVESRIGAGKNIAAEQLGNVAAALRKTTDNLRESEESDGGLSDYVARAASGVDSVSRYLQTRTLSQLIDDAESYARREPAMFFAGAFFAGVLGGRFLKAAAPSGRSNGDVRGPSARPRSIVRARRRCFGPKGRRP